MAVAQKGDPLKQQKDSLNIKNNAVEKYIPKDHYLRRLRGLKPGERYMPDQIDSIAVYDRDKLGVPNDMADAAEKYFGTKIDVSTYRPNYKKIFKEEKANPGSTRAAYQKRKKEYGLDKKKK